MAGMRTHRRDDYMGANLANPVGFVGLLKLGIRGTAEPGDFQHLAPWTRGVWGGGTDGDVAQ